MIQRFKNSWNLFVNSVDVLMRYPKLLLFPLVTACCVIAIALFFLGTFLFQPTGHSYSDKAHWKSVATSVFTAESLNEVNQAKKGDLRFNTW